MSAQWPADAVMHVKRWGGYVHDGSLVVSSSRLPLFMSSSIPRQEVTLVDLVPLTDIYNRVTCWRNNWGRLECRRNDDDNESFFKSTGVWILIAFLILAVVLACVGLLW